MWDWMFPSYTTSCLKFPSSQKHWQGSLHPYPFNQSPDTVSLFVKRNKNVSAPESTISLFSSSGRQDAVRVLGVSHVRFHFPHHNQSNMGQLGPVGPWLSREILLHIWPRCSLSDYPGRTLTMSGDRPSLHLPPGPSSISRVIKMKEICYDWFTWLGSCLLDDFIVWLLAVKKYNAILTYLVLVGRERLEWKPQERLRGMERRRISIPGAQHDDLGGRLDSPFIALMLEFDALAF